MKVVLNAWIRALGHALRWLRRHGLAVALGCGPSLVGLIVVAALRPLRAHHKEFAAATTWGLAILMSFVGWGSGLAMLLYPARRLDWGLRGALGMAISLAIGGILAVLSAVSGWA